MTTRNPLLRLLPLMMLAASLLLGSGCSPREEGERLSFAGRDPSLRWGADGALHIAYVQEDGDGHVGVLYRRLEGGKQLTEPATVSPPTAEVNAHGEVPPRVEVLPDGTLLVAYTVAQPGRFQGEIHWQRSTDGGATWSPPRKLHDDVREGEMAGSHSFLHSAVNAQGEAVFAWLDNRGGEQGLHTARLGAEGGPSPNATVDPRTCQCCSTHLLATGGARLWLAYRDLEADDVRDIAITFSEDQGESFRPPKPLAIDGWKIAGCPHTGPRLTEGADGAVWATWFTAGESRGPGIFVARSDGEGGFGEAVPIARPEGEIAGVAHPELATLPDGRLAALWEEASGVGPRIVGRWHPGQGNPAAGWSLPVVIAEGGSYPRLASSDHQAMVSFTASGGDGDRVILLPPSMLR